ncbi:MAG: DUF3427 domain-containing protein [Spirochaetia bacterium]|nr:DUF3427 domain-containing protein [Spirochaetia bacterium]MCF7941311.1 DUF3427 domain-containing protein [Spirochaetia bacterium]
MRPGLYELITNRAIRTALAQTETLEGIEEPLHEADSAHYLAQYLQQVIRDALEQMPRAKDLPALERQIHACNRIIDQLSEADHRFEDYRIDDTGHRLMEVLLRKGTGLHRPDTPVSLGALLTGTRGDPSLVSQLQKEICSCERVDILCSFIKWSGIRILKDALEQLTGRGGTVRVITTSYMGATEARAIDMLCDLPNTEVQISYDTHRTRLHAKAYLFSRTTGFSTAYIGSSNISYAALTEGLEWNTKISEYEQPYQWNKIQATFETYWHDKEFIPYTHADRDHLERALQSEQPGSKDHQADLQFFDLRPYGFQQEILESIIAERVIGHRTRHLIIAATGTGKTMIAAFDYRNWVERWKREQNTSRTPRFLFIAHRREILEQSLYAFRMVLRDQNFGSIMNGTKTPQHRDQLFLSVQTFRSRKFTQEFPPDYYDYIVIDEFHHAAAASYHGLMHHFTPASLLCLTATPERTDGQDLFEFFDNHITAEIRLPDAIERKLLSPFQYFGVTDTVDYSKLSWTSGSYAKEELDRLLTGNHARAQHVMQMLSEYVLAPSAMRAVGFCATKNHARYMAEYCNDHGLRAACLTADSPEQERESAKDRLRERTVNCIFVVDLYNEGVDIPEIDTILFLRPTESLTIFLQQLGRGLRLYEQKDCLTVLDFVGHAHRQFRFDLRVRALLSRGVPQLKDEIEAGFPHLPSGCSMQFERVAKEHILENIRGAISTSKSSLISRIRSFEKDTGKRLTLARFLEIHTLSLEDIYKRSSWSALCAEAGVIPGYNAPDEQILAKGLRKLTHIDDIEYITTLERLLTTGIEDLSERELRYAEMGVITLFGASSQIGHVSQALRRIEQNRALADELLELLMLRKSQIQTAGERPLCDQQLPLRLHAQYTRDEILIAMGHWDLTDNPPVQAGVLYLPKVKTDLLFITLDKDEKHYSPTTMYKDYAIDEEFFHWQSQSRTRTASPTGQRYINQKAEGTTVLLFVREYRKSSSGSRVQPYYFLGPADHVSHESECPMNIIWKLRSPMPRHLQTKTQRLITA